MDARSFPAGVAYFILSSLLWMGFGSAAESGNIGTSFGFLFFAMLISGASLYCFYSSEESEEDSLN